MPRQNGKGTVYEIRALAGLYLLNERLIMWSAHEYKTAMEGFRRILGLITDTDDLRRRVFKVSNTNGDEGIELHGEGRSRVTGRQRLRFIARSKGSGRGFSGECNLLDEVFALTEEQVAALLPTVSAQPNAQLVYASSPPLDALTGQPLFALRRRGEAGDDPGLGWFDWSVPAEADLDDPAVWARANPALGARISVETVERERRSMTAAAFARERLGVWPDAAGAAVVSPEQWQALAVEAGARPAEVTFMVDVSPDRQSAAILSAGYQADGRALLSVVDHRAGTDWIAERCGVLKRRWDPLVFVLDGKSPAATLLPGLAEQGITTPDDPDRVRRGDLVVLGTADVAIAWGWFVDAARQGLLAHLDEVPLTVALAGAKTRPLGDGSAWARRGGTDITPLVAATGAYWALKSYSDVAAAEAEPSALWL